ncbi:MAG: phosphoribosylanthranilate isomerase [Acidobacteriota bacterium]
MSAQRCRAAATPPSRTSPWIKVCGVCTLLDLEACAGAGATHVGINTWRRSPRYVPLERVQPLVLVAVQMRLVPVLIVVDGSFSSEELAASLPVSFVQMLVPPREALRRRLAERGCGIVEARPARPETIGRQTWGDVLLLDSFAPNHPGGTGRSFRWELARTAGAPFVIAGGLNPDNVADAIATCAPAGVDAASGLESRAGVKDAGRIRAFCAAAMDGFRCAQRKEGHHAF